MTSFQIENSTEISQFLEPTLMNSIEWNPKTASKYGERLTLFQLCKELYSQVIDYRASKVFWPVKIRSVNLYHKIKEVILDKNVRANVYNTLINVWLEHHMPYTTTFIPYSQFQISVPPGLPGICEDLLKNFYQNACAIWNSLEEPSFEEIKNACIVIVARTITAPEYYDFGEIFSSFFLTLINKHDELTSLEEFIYLIRNFEGINWFDPKRCREMCEDFYIFAKRFILVDFPLSSAGHSFSRLAHMYAKDRISEKINRSFDFLEENIEKHVLKKYADRDSFAEDMLTSKNIYIQRSLTLFYKIRKARSLLIRDFAHRVKDNRLYVNLDKAFRMEERYHYTLDLLERGNLMFKEQLLNPALSLVSYSLNNTKNTVKIVLNGLDLSLDLSSKIKKLTEKYTYLKDTTMQFCQNNVVIRVPIETAKNYGHEIKDEIASLYSELRELNLQRVQGLSCQLYKQAIQKLRLQKTFPDAFREKEQRVGTRIA